MTTDSAGTPWEGRELRPHPFAGDSGEADSGLLKTLEAVAADSINPRLHESVLKSLAEQRLYAPIIPVAVDHEVGDHGHMVDNSSDMAMVRLQSADGRECTPAFCSIPPLTSWHPQARPVPIEAERLVLGAVEAGSQLVILDPGTPHSFLLRRPALFAFAQGLTWTPSWADAEVAQRIAAISASVPGVARISVGPGSAKVHVDGPELGITLEAQTEIRSDNLESFQRALAEDPMIVDRVDSLTMRISPRL